ncbi:Mu transposase C-terminal domain-containing protein [Peribacillus acanthi]|uniref:Mu transposase C-terminal domain-containing protein n=1 Tax=Peribacillus acanthi TaxID=2171554 RepID=UPI000D3E2592|nr:Mu transposase C-terminal domain-containing protein [Peribacillus acanthi]
MKLAENMLFKYGSGKVIRVLYINPFTSIIYVIDMDSNRWSYPIPKDDFLTAYQNKEMIEENDDIYCRAVPEEELNELEKQKRDQAWEIVTFFKSKLSDDEHMFISKYRQKAMKETMVVFSISYNGLKNILIKYFKGSQTKCSLLPSYFRSGARGKERKAGNKKRGRPRKNGENAGVNIDENIKKVFKIGLNRYYYNTRKNSLKTTYELILKDFFVKEVIDENGVKIPVLNNVKDLPTYEQFLYWFRKSLNDGKREIIKREGTRVYQQNYRAIIGSSTQDAELGPGTLFQIDSTIFDCHLVSSFNRDIIVSRPILFLIMDVYSRLIVGFNITFESLNSYSGAMVALANSMTSKKELCKKYGIEIEDNEFPFCVPNRILSDRGELVNGYINGSIQNLGIIIQQTPAYHADYKGIIEQAFNQTNIKILPFVDGAVIGGNSKRERGEGLDYRLKSSMTIEDFTKVIIKSILFHNNHHVLSDYILEESMIENNVEKIPIRLWEHGLKYKKGQLRILPEEVIKTSLLPSQSGLITPKGLSFKKMLYASKYALENNWFQMARIKGNWKVKVCYNPTDLTDVLVFDEYGDGPFKFSLLEHLSMYSGKGESEIEQIKNFERELERTGKERELQEKMKLFTEIEDIVKEAREKTEAEKDYSKSNSQRLKGIKENQKNERLLHREKAKKEREMEVILDESIEEEDEFAMFRDWEESNDDE